MRPLILFLGSLLQALAADPFTVRVIAFHDWDTMIGNGPYQVFKVRLFGISQARLLAPV